MCFDVQNSKMQQFRFNKTICQRISPFIAPSSTTTLVTAGSLQEENVSFLTQSGKFSNISSFLG